MIGLGGRAMAFGGAFGSDARRFEIAVRSPGEAGRNQRFRATAIKVENARPSYSGRADPNTNTPGDPPFFASGSRPRQLALIPTLSSDADSDARGLAARDCARRLLSRK